MRLYPNVKLNLGLHVLGMRPDGYHNIETVFLPYYGYSDCLEIVPAPNFEISIFGSEYSGWEPAKDICADAWRLLREDFDIDSVHISLEKCSPVGAGLGGGSADAAFTLMGLNDIFSLGLSLEQMADYASRLGSDCAFFIYNKPCFASGRGEILEPIELPLDAYRFEVFVPQGVQVSTKEAYADLVRRPQQKPDDVSLKELLLQTPVERWRNLIVNDFEASVFPKYPEIKSLKDDFYARGAVYASMSGSGSAVFGMFPK